MLAQTTTEVDTGGLGIVILLSFAVGVVVWLSTYFIFKKAGPNGEPAWSGLIPIWQTWTLMKVIGRPPLWFWLLFGLGILSGIPVLGFIAGIAFLVLWIIVLLDLSKSFGKGGGFTVGLVLLPVVFFPMLAWGSAQYVGPAAASGGSVGMGGTDTPPPPPPPPAG